MNQMSMAQIAEQLQLLQELKSNPDRLKKFVIHISGEREAA